MTKEVKLVYEYNQVRTKDNFPGYKQNVVEHLRENMKTKSERTTS